MAKKAKRRGRPPGAKSPDKMDVGQLRQYIEKLQGVLEQKGKRTARLLRGKVVGTDRLWCAEEASAVLRAAAAAEEEKGTRSKATPKYRSRKDPKILWSGRGVTPVWMREEMKGTKLKKDDFLIKQREAVPRSEQAVGKLAPTGWKSLRRRLAAIISLSSQMFVTIAVDQMVVDHPGRLHEGVNDRRPDEFEAAAGQFLRHRASRPAFRPAPA